MRGFALLGYGMAHSMVARSVPCLFMAFLCVCELGIIRCFEPKAVSVLTRVLASFIVIVMLCWATATLSCSCRDIVCLAVCVLRITLWRLSHASVLGRVESHPRIVIR